jgi:hypothetical protein
MSLAMWVPIAALTGLVAGFVISDPSVAVVAIVAAVGAVVLIGVRRTILPAVPGGPPLG